MAEANLFLHFEKPVLALSGAKNFKSLVRAQTLSEARNIRINRFFARHAFVNRQKFRNRNIPVGVFPKMGKDFEQNRSQMLHQRIHEIVWKKTCLLNEFRIGQKDLKRLEIRDERLHIFIFQTKIQVAEKIAQIFKVKTFKKVLVPSYPINDPILAFGKRVIVKNQRNSSVRIF